jgi:hypothetical protein
MPKLLILAAAASTLAIAACSKPAATDTPTETASTIETGVVREATPDPVPSPTPMAAAPAIQTQAGPKGSQVALNRVAVTGDIMTVSMTFSGGDCCTYTKVDQVSVIDDATSQRISVLKDNAGNWMAAPMYSNDKEVRIDSSKPAVVWFKFPAPPATSKTVSITLPEVAPFDAVTVTR